MLSETKKRKRNRHQNWEHFIEHFFSLNKILSKLPTWNFMLGSLFIYSKDSLMITRKFCLDFDQEFTADKQKDNTNDTDCTKIPQGAEQHKKEQSYQRDRKIATTTTEERTYPEHHQLNEQLSGYTTTKPTTTATTITIAKKRILKGGTSRRYGGTV